MGTFTELNKKMSEGDNEEEKESGIVAIPKDTLRDHLVTTAVKFLQNPKVRGTTLAKKRDFLRKKGLSDKEIELACQRAGTFLDDDQIQALALQSYPSSRTSLFLKAMDVANMIALISIGSYSLYSLWKNYIAPRIFGTRSLLEQKYERLLDAITQLNKNVVELREMFRDMQLQQSMSTSRSTELQDIKKDVVAIKSLLLGQSQFPSPSPSTGIPSWQMVEGDEHSDESSTRRRTKKDKERLSARQGPRTNTDDSHSEISERGEEEVLQGPMRKHPSLDSNNGFQSESSCEVVHLSKNDSSDPDHSHSE